MGDKKFYVTVTVHTQHTYVVEAANEEHAKDVLRTHFYLHEMGAGEQSNKVEFFSEFVAENEITDAMEVPDE